MNGVNWKLVLAVLFQVILTRTEQFPRTPKLSDSSTCIKLPATPTAPKAGLPKPDSSSNEPQGQVKHSKATGVQRTKRLGARKKSIVYTSITSNVPKISTGSKPTLPMQGIITDKHHCSDA